MSAAMTESGALALCEIARLRLEQREGDNCMLSAVASQALQAASNPECEVGDLAAIVERDTRLTSEVLSLANSAAYAPTSRILTLHQAVTRLGFQATKNLVLSTSVASMMRKASLESEWVREQLWRHAFTTGLMAMRLNAALRCGFQGEEFTAGLIHDIGRTLYAAVLPNQFAEIDELSFEESEQTLELERERAGGSHCELGAWYLRRSSLPSPLVMCAEYHHTPALAPENIRLVSLVSMADHMANHLQRMEQAEGYRPEDNAGLQVLIGQGVRGCRERFLDCYLELMTGVHEDALTMSAL